MYYLVLLAYFLSFVLLSYTLVSILWPKKTVLSEQLSFYESSWRAAHAQVETELELGEGIKDRLKKLIVRSVNKRPAVEFIQKKLELSGVKMDWAEFVLYHLLGVVGAGTLIWMLAGLKAALGSIPICVWLPIVFLDIMTGRRRAAFAAQLPETMTMLSGSLKAGYSLLQAVDMVAQEVPPPMSEEFKRVLADARLGLPVEEALDRMNARAASKSFDWMVLAVKIQREVGGNLSEVLATLAATIRQRDTLLRQIKVLTAEGRLSAIILLALPVAVSLALYFLNRRYIMLLFAGPSGWAMAAAALALMGVGSFWLWRIVKIEV